LAPHLPHGLGDVPLRELAHRLDEKILNRFGADSTVDLLGFSMGGIIGRIWLQELGGAARTRRFFSVGSPHQGTITAQAIPRLLLAGAADMKIGSHLLHQLNRSSDQLSLVQCQSFFLPLGFDGVSWMEGCAPAGIDSIHSCLDASTTDDASECLEDSWPSATPILMNCFSRSPGQSGGLTLQCWQDAHGRLRRPQTVNDFRQG